MNIQEFNDIKEKNYIDYCKYLKNKYGLVPNNYFDEKWDRDTHNSRAAEGLFIHHICENQIANLSNPTTAKQYDYAFQYADKLCYANYLEHMWLHYLITVENPDSGLGGGGLQKIIDDVEEYIDAIDKGWREAAIKIVEDNFETYVGIRNIVDRVFAEEEKRSIVFEHNETTYMQLVDTLEKDNKAYICIGTGLGKTTTALQYLKDINGKALVLAHRNTILQNWGNNKNIETMTYQSLVKKPEGYDWGQYDVIICDEAHHCSPSNGWGQAVKRIIDSKTVKVIGLSAEEKRTDGIKIADAIFGGNFIEGVTVVDGIKKGILHPFSYVGAIYDKTEFEQMVEDENIDKQLRGELDLALNNTPTVEEIITKHLPQRPNKGIIFVSNIAAIPEAIDIIKKVCINDEIRPLHSRMSEKEQDAAKEWFENTDHGFLIAVDMISEGMHFSGINTLFMFRRTESPLVFNQQIGRIVTLAKKENPQAIVFDLVNNANNIKYKKTKSALLSNELNKVLKDVMQERKNDKSDQIIVKDYTEDILVILDKIKKQNYGNRRPVICLETKEIFPSVQEAEITKGACKVNEVCRGKRNISGGYHWAYLEEYRKWDENKQNEYYGHTKTRGSNEKRPVICLETKEIFPSVQEVRTIPGLSKVGEVCRGRRKKAGGYHWAFLSDYETWTEEEQNQYYKQ